MIPNGYWTIPEVLHYISMRDDLGEWAGTHKHAVDWIWAAMADGELQVFVLDGMRAARLAYEDVQEIIDDGERAGALMLGPPAWLASGKVPRPEWNTGKWEDVEKPRREQTLLEQISRA